MSEHSKVRWRLGFPREVLLVEIERRCVDAQCNGVTRLGLTKDEARVFHGFTCERCEQWNEDVLCERDVPEEWWEELRVTGLDGVRERPGSGVEAVEPGEVVTRLSEAWRRAFDEESLEGVDEAD